MRESRIEQHLVDVVKDMGGIAYKFKSPGRANVEDRLVMLPGATLWLVELKATGETPNDAQLREHARHRALGFSVIVLDSIEAVDEWASRVMVS